MLVNEREKERKGCDCKLPVIYLDVVNYSDKHFITSTVHVAFHKTLILQLLFLGREVRQRDHPSSVRRPLAVGLVHVTPRDPQPSG